MRSFCLDYIQITKLQGKNLSRNYVKRRAKSKKKIKCPFGMLSFSIFNFIKFLYGIVFWRLLWTLPNFFHEWIWDIPAKPIHRHDSQCNTKIFRDFFLKYSLIPETIFRTWFNGFRSCNLGDSFPDGKFICRLRHSL